MFLVVIVTVVISILGLFMQILSLQTARLAASQNGLLQTMIVWHNTGVGITTTQSIDTLPCQLTSTTTINSLPNCKHGGVSMLISAAVPTGYSTANYSFISAVFASTSPVGKFIFTYAHDADSTGNMILPQTGGTAIGYTFRDLQTQMGRALPVNLAHGSVNAAGLLSVTFKNNSGTSVTGSYTIPATIPTGAVGLVSSAQ